MLDRFTSRRFQQQAVCAMFLTLSLIGFAATIWTSSRAAAKAFTVENADDGHQE